MSANMDSGTAFSKRIRRRIRSAELTFVSSVAILSLLALYSLGRQYSTEPSDPGQHVLRSLNNKSEDVECRFVHNVHGRSQQCSFIRQNCPDEEAGLISYLELYYCSLGNFKAVAFTIIVTWSALLFSTIGVAASDFLCVNLSTIATILGMSESLTGVTFLAFGNGSPDVFSTFAAMKSNSGSLAVGELMGAAGFITAVVAGSMAITKPFQVGRKSFIRDVAFFAVAASFSLVFLRDGSLRLWECVAMVAFYICYVVFVVVWHWYLQRQRRQRLAELSARLHHHIPEQQELEDPDIEIDEESRPAGERSPLMRGISDASIPTLKTPHTPAWMNTGNDDEDDEDDGKRALAELQSNMRIDRSRHSRRNTITPIRPSLIGAIEFRSVLNALEKKSTGNSIGLRRYSDDNRDWNNSAAPTQPRLTVTSPDTSRAGTTVGRNRAVSAGNATLPQWSEDLLDVSRATPETVIYSPNGRQTSTNAHRRVQSEFANTDHLSPMYTGAVLLSPSSLSSSSGAPSPHPNYSEQNGMLAPPNTTNVPSIREPDYFTGIAEDIGSSGTDLDPAVPILHAPDPHHRKPPIHQDFHSPAISPRGSRPPSIRLPSSSIASETFRDSVLSGEFGSTDEVRRYKWWPYQYFDPPQVILGTLFPSLVGWRSRGIFGKLAALATAPSIFLLTITLPVVEASDDSNNLPDADTTTATPGHGPGLVPDTPTISVNDISRDERGPHPHKTAISRQNTDSFEDVDESLEIQREWHRWLVIVQIFTSPIFCVLIVYANMDDQHTLKELLILILGCLVFSLICLLLLLATTTPTREPKYKPVLCFLGFLVAIAWISTIANEVVGVLKALGVILNMSDAILGLTIFAVGNSLGDLVADITIARMGYPKMALSACFGGPMLNILLGIGLGGMYIIIRNSNHSLKKHPSRPRKLKPYELEVSTTLMISGIALLVTLMGLLVVVPLNRWRMDRKIGIGLIALWILATTGNVIIEVLGVGEGTISNLIFL